METGLRALTQSDLNVVDTTKQNSLGALGFTADGRFFRYASIGYVSGTSTFNPGLVFFAAAAPANSTNLAITATTVATANQTTANLQAGSRTLVLTNGSTAVWQDQFADGYLDLIISAGGTYKLRIVGNTAAAASTGYVTLLLADPLPPNITQLIPGTDTANLRYSPWHFVIPTTTESKAIGASLVPLTGATAALSSTVGPGSWGWLQTKGPAWVAGTSGTLGYPVGQDVTTTAGAVINKSSGTTTEEFGTFITTVANGGGNVYLKID